MAILPVSRSTEVQSGGTMNAVFASAVGIDVHAKILACCFQWYDFETAASQQESATFGTSQSQLREFAEWVKARRPNRIVMESTGVLWHAPYEALEKAGFTNSELILANARDVKGKKGHKTDANDAAYFAELGRLDAVRGSFVPKKVFRTMRTISRAYMRSRQDFARAKNRKSKTLNQIGTRAGSVFSDINGKCAKAILSAWVENSSELDAVIKSKSKMLKHSADEIWDALSPLGDEQRELLKLQQKQIEEIEETSEQYLELLRQIQKPYQEIVDRLMTIPQIKEVSARLILAELGDDLSSVPSIRHFSSWAGICPGVKESAGKTLKGARAPKGNQWLKTVLVEVANGISLTKSGFLRGVFQKFKERRGRGRAIVALAHKLLRVIYTLIKGNCCYKESDLDVMKKFRAKRLARAVRQAEYVNLGLDDGVVFDRTTGEVLAT